MPADLPKPPTNLSGSDLMTKFAHVLSFPLFMWLTFMQRELVKRVLKWLRPRIPDLGSPCCSTLYIITPIMENQMEKKMENEMETGVILYPL